MALVSKSWYEALNELVARYQRDTMQLTFNFGSKQNYGYPTRGSTSRTSSTGPSGPNGTFRWSQTTGLELVTT
ncbi:unnamed protein product [Peronospora destructor]|uniref:Uncharacterized protein n=1 Tax=Peronospora destructor TaxID=86335 RepID=A0AAV0TZK9_9STRA|nr:unnamed protein product [Peronospora destructor]